MFFRRFNRFALAVAITACAVGFSTAPLHAAPPTAPSNLVFFVTGQTATLTWTPSANGPTSYVIQAGLAPGQIAASFPVSGALTSFSATAGPGTYFVRVVAVNAEGASPPSNEVMVVISCAPSEPLNLRAIQRGTEAFLLWSPPLNGAPNSYVIQAGLGPGQTIAQFQVSSTTMNANVGGGSYSVRVFATSACGQSPATSDITVTFPSNSGRVADPAPGTTLAMPDVQGLIERYAAQNRPTIANTCPNGRKYEPNPWLNGLIDFLRSYDTRFGYNAKPTKTQVDNNGFPVIAAGDEMAFYPGAGNGEGSSQVYVFDVLFNHCGTSDPGLDYRNIAPEPAIWTGAGRFAGDEHDEQ